MPKTIWVLYGWVKRVLLFFRSFVDHSFLICNGIAFRYHRARSWLVIIYWWEDGRLHVYFLSYSVKTSCPSLVKVSSQSNALLWYGVVNILNFTVDHKSCSRYNVELSEWLNVSTLLNVGKNQLSLFCVKIRKKEGSLQKISSETSDIYFLQFSSSVLFFFPNFLSECLLREIFSFYLWELAIQNLPFGDTSLSKVLVNRRIEK